MEGSRSSRPVWLRLVGLLLIPLVGMALAITPSLRRAHRAAAAADALARDAAELERLIELQSAVAREQVSAEALSRTQALGVSPALVSSVLGFDPGVRLEPDRAAVDAAIAKIVGGSVDEVSKVKSDLASLRTLSISLSKNESEIYLGYRSVQGQLVRAVDRATRSLAAGNDVATAGGARQIADLTSVIKISHAGIEEIAALSEMLLTASIRSQAHANLIAWSATYTNEVAELRETSARWRARLDAVADDQRFAFLGPILHAAGSTTVEQSFGWDTTIKVLGAGSAYANAMTGLATTATTDTMTWARRRSADASRDLLRLSVEAGVTLVGTAVLAFGVARMISRHLGRLARKAEHLSEGRLDEASGPPTGPREIATVGRALNDAVTNLRHIEAQAAALAAGRLDDPSLEQAAPGQLGALVHGSVGQLAGAWRERELLRERLQHEATHDRLTGLPNRSVAIDALRGALQGELPAAVLFVDLDGFKAINDSYGHLFGDRVLRHVAAKLSDAVRRGDVLARLGGDEFVVVAAGVDSSDVAMRLGERLRSSVATIDQVDGRTIDVGASVGVAMAPEHGSDETALIGRADEAVYAAKRAGRGSVVMHGAGV